MTKSFKSFFLLFSSPLFFMLSGCANTPIDYDVKPKHEPVYNFTQSSKVLSCLGRKIEASRKFPIDVFVSDIPDHTIPSIESGFLTKNAVMMVTTALGRLDTEKVAVIGRNGAMKGRRQVQVLGSFTELNRTIDSQALSGEAVFPGGIELELGGDKNANHVALDLAMSEQNRIIPKTATSVSVQVHGNSGNATLTYDEGDDFAAIGAIGFTGQEGFHSSQRLLIETSVALMMSKYFEVDIRDCLNSNRRENPPEIQTEYDEPIFQKSNVVNESLENPNHARLQAVPPSPPVSNTSQQPYPRRQRPEIVQAPPSPPLPIAPSAASESFREDEPIQLLEKNGVVVLPSPQGPRFLRAQPPEYNQTPSQDDFSGVPRRNIEDPAQEPEHSEFLEYEGADINQGYVQTF